jgi:hypothetical protein
LSVKFWWWTKLNVTKLNWNEKLGCGKWYVYYCGILLMSLMKLDKNLFQCARTRFNKMNYRQQLKLIRDKMRLFWVNFTLISYIISKLFKCSNKISKILTKLSNIKYITRVTYKCVHIWRNDLIKINSIKKIVSQICIC